MQAAIWLEFTLILISALKAFAGFVHMKTQQKNYSREQAISGDHHNAVFLFAHVANVLAFDIVRLT
jgi:hypothetical protein